MSIKIKNLYETMLKNKEMVSNLQKTDEEKFKKQLKENIEQSKDACKKMNEQEEETFVNNLVSFVTEENKKVVERDGEVNKVNSESDSEFRDFISGVESHDLCTDPILYDVSNNRNFGKNSKISELFCRDILLKKEVTLFGRNIYFTMEATNYWKKTSFTGGVTETFYDIIKKNIDKSAEICEKISFRRNECTLRKNNVAIEIDDYLNIFLPELNIYIINNYIRPNFYIVYQYLKDLNIDEIGVDEKFVVNFKSYMPKQSSKFSEILGLGQDVIEKINKETEEFQLVHPLEKENEQLKKQLEILRKKIAELVEDSN